MFYLCVTAFDSNDTHEQYSVNLTLMYIEKEKSFRIKNLERVIDHSSDFYDRCDEVLGLYHIR
jgi:hypothetical protein